MRNRPLLTRRPIAWGETSRIRAASDCETHLPVTKSFFEKMVECLTRFRLSFDMGRCTILFWIVWCSKCLGRRDNSRLSRSNGTRRCYQHRHAPDHHHLSRRQRWLQLKLSALYFIRKPRPACVFLTVPRCTTDLNGHRPSLASFFLILDVSRQATLGSWSVTSPSVAISAKAAPCRNALHGAPSTGSS